MIMKGFSLLETIVAISILTLALLGPLALAAFALRSASLSENQVIAFNLAEEVMEFVINKRDSNIFAGAGNWLEGLTNCQSANGCFVDVTNNSVQRCSANCPFLKRNSSSGLYNYASGPDTIFRRRTVLENVGSNQDERKVKVSVSWAERFGNRSFTLEHNIFKKR